MLKYNILVHHAGLDTFLTRLQELGLVHVETRAVKNDTATDAIVKEIEQCDKVQSALQAVKIDRDAPTTLAPFTGDAAALAAVYAETRDRLTALDAQIHKTEKDINDALPWGDFDRSDVERLLQLGLKPRFYSVKARSFIDDWAQRYPIYEINRDADRIYFVLLHGVGQDLDFELQEVRLPQSSYTQLLAELKQLNAEYRDAAGRLQSLALAVETLAVRKRALLEQLDFNLAQLSARDEVQGSVKALTGWLPKDRQSEFEAFLNRSEACWLLDEQPDEEPPVLLKNGRFARLFEPLTALYSMPCYREIDPTPFFAPFYMLFFGFCLGDGGYGLTIAVVATLLKVFKFREAGSVRDILTLAQWLGVATLLFGFVTATFFGISIDQIKLDRFAEKALGLGENYGMMLLSIALGVVQIIFAMFVNVARIVYRKGWRYAWSRLAWTLLIIFGAVAFLLRDSGGALYCVALAIAGVSALVAFFYNSPGKNPIINFGGGIWDAYNMASGLLGDSLSYIRLFALGMTGGILGGVFNSLAAGANEGLGIPVVGQLVALLILVFGHGLSFFLGVLGAAIHPLRLTFVEFYKNEGFEGGGLPFKLFRKY
jgi:V/A-type H+-transporting ATPase subunit I